MNSKTKFLTFVTLTLAISSLTISTVVAKAKLTNQSKLFINGIGAVQVGMTVRQAAINEIPDFSMKSGICDWQFSQIQ
ncbi:hypothetical protein [Nostoc sp.]|uniref:hypothetical protein n=1 Tax=Nostoc sp. TaxID=1180 RepID=UPI002FFB056E